MNKQSVHVVPHMHWDREWYFSTEESRILLINNMEEILTRLETDSSYPYFVLDGQTVILEDYLSVKPEDKQRIKSLVKAGKLIIGPWYTQTDEMIVSGESIVRNLLYGHKDAKEFGDIMKIGYLPDSFGQSEQMPHLLQGFNISKAMFWRGMSEYNGTFSSEFMWKSLSGEQVKTVLLPDGYAIGKYLPLEKKALKKKMDKNFSILDERATTSHVLIPNGHDQMPIQQNIHEVIAELEEMYTDRSFFLSRFEDLFEEITKEEKNVEIVQGEFLHGKYMRVHKSIYSTRMDIKTLHTQLENKIINELEPLMTLAYKLGFEYHHKLLEIIWKEIMKNHAHDSIGCCCSDKVHREIKERFILTEERVDQLINFYMRKIVDAMPNDPHQDKLTVFHLFPEKRKTSFHSTLISKEKTFKLVDEHGKEPFFEILEKKEIDPGLIDRQIVHYGNYDPYIEYKIVIEDELPSMGYKTYEVVTGVDKIDSLQEEPVREKVLENDFYLLSFHSSGQVSIYDKSLNYWFNDVLTLENGGDEGDEYDYSPPEKDWVLTSADKEATIQLIKRKLEQKAKVNVTMTIPTSLEERERKKATKELQVEWNIHLPNNEKRIDINCTIHNQSDDHRIRVLMPTNIKAVTSLAEQPFGTIERPIHDPALDIWEKEKWSERPDAINPMLGFVSVYDENIGLSILTNSSREYEVIDNKGTLALTLLRSVGVLGKAELTRRPGRPSGIALPTPDSQMHGQLSMSFSIMTHAGDPLLHQVPRETKNYNTRVLVYNKIQHDAMRMNPSTFNTPASYSFFSQEDTDTVLSTVKKEEEGDGIIIRSFNPSRYKKSITSLIDGNWKSYYETYLDERKAKLTHEQNFLRKEIEACSSQTWCVK